MKILAVDTTGLVASAAVLTDDKLTAEYTLNYKKTHSQTLMPMIEKICADMELELETLDYIACASGPGSFTGLRIGAAAAKGLAHGLGIKIIPVPTLDALAYNLPYSEKIVVPIMDARRDQVYTAFFSTSGGKLEKLSEYMAEDINVVLDKLAGLTDSAVFLGDGVPVFKERILAYQPGHTFAPPCSAMQRAACVAALAAQRIPQAVDCDEFEILYLRKSQAEREMGL
ncbi:MAG: tRNA (adenosine(37)-N6)-threonylcarbamoyltransferase complex dimerization subunit type 1 TsaB [Firmicutes bacterium]|nr:tRNA (adenosine(37)-N6)-threonylcarbamoyltransferase complex dimerization subunit type 1 TsaB [Bacillota bacterium]